jgi:eukaryotic-like serine/threonine-protein kinase
LEPLIVRIEDTERRSAADHAFSRSPVRIGRSAGNDLRLPFGFVSSWHGLIEFDAASASYTDLGSLNGTRLNGVPLQPREQAVLLPGSEIAIGSLRVTLPARMAAAHPKREPTAAPSARPKLEPTVVRGGITEVMRRLAAAPSGDFERAAHRVLAPGAVIGRFELIREVGRGSFGIVFEAKDRQLGRLVAFKAVRPGRESQVIFRQEMLQQEAEAAAQLSHPNIVSLYDVGTCESGPYLIMELLRGENLRERMCRGRMPLREALEIGIQIAWALDHAHAAGVIHRDLKPANVFLSAGGHVKVLDLGLAHLFGAGRTKALGTPAYMAPEQWREEPQDARTDVFGAAAILAEMVTGRLPYRCTGDHSDVLEPGARPRVDGAEVPRPLAALLRRALSADPDARPRDGHAWLAALLDVHQALDQTAPVEVARQATPPAAAEVSGTARWPRRWRSQATVLAGLALLAVVATVAVLLLR